MTVRAVLFCVVVQVKLSAHELFLFQRYQITNQSKLHAAIPAGRQQQEGRRDEPSQQRQPPGEAAANNATCAGWELGAGS